MRSRREQEQRLVIAVKEHINVEGEKKVEEYMKQVEDIREEEEDLVDIGG